MGDIRHNVADLSKIESTLGFHPKFDFQNGVVQFANWVNQQKIQEDHFAKSIEELKDKGLFK